MSDQGNGARPTLRLGNRTVALQPGARVEREPAKVDVVIAFDTTGSMSGKRSALVDGMGEFIASLDGYRLDWRVSVLPFGDLEIPGDRVVGDLPFVTNADAARGQLAQMPSFSGGSNGGESSIEAMEAALRKTWRARALKVVLLLTDDDALGAHRAPTVTARLRQTDTLCFTAARDTSYFREWATSTGGTWSLIDSRYDATALHGVLKRLLASVALTASTIQRTALGSPQRYRALSAGRSGSG